MPNEVYCRFRIAPDSTMEPTQGVDGKLVIIITAPDKTQRLAIELMPKEVNLLRARLSGPSDMMEEVAVPVPPVEITEGDPPWLPIPHAACPECGARLRYLLNDQGNLSLTCMAGLCYFSIEVTGLPSDVLCLSCLKPLSFMPKMAAMKPVTCRNTWLLCSHCGTRS